MISSFGIPTALNEMSMRPASSITDRKCFSTAFASSASTSASSEDALRPGARVRHPLFGVGTVLRREGAGDDLKVTVSFPGAGAKKLVARYAGLEVV